MGRQGRCTAGCGSLVERALLCHGCDLTSGRHWLCVLPAISLDCLRAQRPRPCAAGGGGGGLGAGGVVLVVLSVLSVVVVGGFFAYKYRIRSMMQQEVRGVVGGTRWRLLLCFRADAG